MGYRGSCSRRDRGAWGFISLYGNAYQKEKYLKPTLAGKLGAAEALTEPRSGSDFVDATTKGEPQGDHYITNGRKRFIVGAEGADYFCLCQNRSFGSTHKSLSLFLVDRGPGVKVEYVYGLMGTRGGGAGRFVFKDVKVPLKNLAGLEHGAGAVFYQMTIPERMTTTAGALGLARASLELAAKFRIRRKAFSKPIKDFQGVSFKVADSISKLDSARALVYMAALVIDKGDDPGRVRRLVSEAKKVSTQMAWDVTNEAMQIMGGIGYTNVYPIERMVRDSRLMMIWTGTSQLPATKVEGLC